MRTTYIGKPKVPKIRKIFDIRSTKHHAPHQPLCSVFTIVYILHLHEVRFLSLIKCTTTVIYISYNMQLNNNQAHFSLCKRQKKSENRLLRNRHYRDRRPLWKNEKKIPLGGELTTTVGNLPFSIFWTLDTSSYRTRIMGEAEICRPSFALHIRFYTTRPTTASMGRQKREIRKKNKSKSPNIITVD